MYIMLNNVSTPLSHGSGLPIGSASPMGKKLTYSHFGTASGSSGPSSRVSAMDGIGRGRPNSCSPAVIPQAAAGPGLSGRPRPKAGARLLDDQIPLHVRQGGHVTWKKKRPAADAAEEPRYRDF